MNKLQLRGFSISLWTLLFLSSPPPTDKEKFYFLKIPKDPNHTLSSLSFLIGLSVNSQVTNMQTLHSHLSLSHFRSKILYSKPNCTPFLCFFFSVSSLAHNRTSNSHLQFPNRNLGHSLNHKPFRSPTDPHPQEPLETCTPWFNF